MKKFIAAVTMAAVSSMAAAEGEVQHINIYDEFTEKRTEALVFEGTSDDGAKVQFYMSMTDKTFGKFLSSFRVGHSYQCKFWTRDQGHFVKAQMKIGHKKINPNMTSAFITGMANLLDDNRYNNNNSYIGGYYNIDSDGDLTANIGKKNLRLMAEYGSFMVRTWDSCGVTRTVKFSAEGLEELPVYRKINSKHFAAQAKKCEKATKRLEKAERRLEKKDSKTNRSKVRNAQDRVDQVCD